MRVSEDKNSASVFRAMSLCPKQCLCVQRNVSVSREMSLCPEKCLCVQINVSVYMYEVVEILYIFVVSDLFELCSHEI